ncbi:hypothetical protein [Haloarcula rubripromontorii]|uniref:hypothetical protein n=1 Tax=Haloarcula rubripromontorii TaxID=1705562 RepID=UPI00345C312A
MATVTDTCDACGERVQWSVERDLQHDHCPECGARHIVSVGEGEAFEHRERTLDERRRRWEDLQPLDEVMGR